MSTEYVFDTASDLGRGQMDHLEALYDGVTVEQLERIGPANGQRCLDIGAGGGSVARWLAARVSPQGSVLAVDLDTDYLVEEPGVTVRRHDINDGVPAGGPFDLIHARLVLMHLSRRADLLRMLVDALAPGGWIVLGDLSDRLPRALSAPTDADAALFDHVLDVGMNVLAPRVDMSAHWAGEVAGRLTEAGLTVEPQHTFCSTTVGGNAGCLLFGNYVRQLEPLLLDVGITEAELARFRRLVADPALRTETYELVYTTARKPSVVEDGTSISPDHVLGERGRGS